MSSRMSKVIRIKVCGKRLSLPPVLFDIVKRRFVRTPWPERDPERLCLLLVDALTAVVCRGETLNLPHMMGLPNRTLGQISRSWSFCANDIESDPAQDPASMRRSLAKDIFGAMGIGNENDQVS